MKIVVVEDDLPIAGMYQAKLKLAGHDVSVAHNGQEGYKLIERLKPDLALVDIRMPVMSGDVMLGKVRSAEWGANLHVVILTNISKDEAPTNLRFLNVDRYIVKAHHTPSQVVEIVHEVLGQAKDKRPLKV